MPAFTPKPISRFPAKFPALMREAAASLHSNLLLGAFSTRLEAERLAEQFRWFRWNIRREPFADRNLTRIEESLNLKLSITDSPAGFLVYLKARPTALSEILTLNPHVADLIPEECQ